MSYASRTGAARGSGTEPTYPSKGASNNSDLPRLGLEYAKLRLRLESYIEQQCRLWPGKAWTEELERRWSRWTNPIRDRMAEVRWQATKLQAKDLFGLKAKATILQDILDSDAEDVRTQLTLSLCRDLISFSDTADVDHRDQELVEFR